MEKKKRQELFKAQNCHCALCLVQAPDCKGWVYIPDQHALVCRRCCTSIKNYVNSMARGITPDVLERFLAVVHPKMGTKTKGEAAESTSEQEIILIGGVRCDATTGEPVE